jgi:hypothetical protein
MRRTILAALLALLIPERTAPQTQRHHYARSA